MKSIQESIEWTMIAFSILFSFNKMKVKVRVTVMKQIVKTHMSQNVVAKQLDMESKIKS